MEKSVEDFLVQGAKNADYTNKYLTSLLSKNSKYPPHILEIIQNIRLHAEEDHSNFLHLQSVLPHARARRVDLPPLDLEAGQPIREEIGRSEVIKTDGIQGSGDGEVETGVVAGDEDDLFMLEGVEDSRSPQSLTFSDGEGEESDGDEGIHLPRKRDQNRVQIAASLPVGIPWPEHLNTSAIPMTGKRVKEGDDEEEHPRDIAASIQAMARSVHQTYDVFGELPPPRRNTMSKQ